MPKIRKRAREFVEYAARHYEPVQWAHFDDPDDDLIYYHDIRRNCEGPDSWCDVPIWVIPNTHGRNALGGSSTYDMSNHRSMLRDFPYGTGGLIVVRWSNVDELAIRLDKVSRELLEACEGLLDYPLYDESDHSELEQELEAENWDLYGRHDFVRELEQRDYSADDVPEDALDEAFWEACQQFNVYAEFEFDACHWRGMGDDEFVEFVAGKLGLRHPDGGALT